MKAGCDAQINVAKFLITDIVQQEVSLSQQQCKAYEQQAKKRLIEYLFSGTNNKLDGKSALNAIIAAFSSNVFFC